MAQEELKRICLCVYIFKYVYIAKILKFPINNRAKKGFFFACFSLLLSDKLQISCEFSSKLIFFGKLMGKIALFLQDPKFL